MRHFVLANQKNWVELLDVVQFCHNLHSSSSTRKSPFELATGRQPLTPPEVVKNANSKCPTVARLARDRQECLDEARDNLMLAQRNMKWWTDVHRRPLDFQPGDKVLLRLTPHMIRQVRKTAAHQALVPRHEGPFVVERRVGNLAYKLGLPSRLRLHPVFRVSQLKKFFEDHDDPIRSKLGRAPP